MTLEEIRNNNYVRLQELIEANSKNEIVSKIEQILRLELEIQKIRVGSNQSLTPNEQLIDTYRISKLESDIARIKGKTPYYDFSIEEYTKRMCEIRIRETMDKYLNKKPFTFLDVKYITEYLDVRDIKANTPREVIMKDMLLRRFISMFDFNAFTMEEMQIMREIEQRSLEGDPKQI
jgi:LysM repeat protein